MKRILPSLVMVIFCGTLAFPSFILTNADMASTWNIVIAHADGAGYGTATLAAGTPFGSLTSGTDTIVYLSGITDTNNASTSFHNFFQSYYVHPSGLFSAESTSAGLAADLVETGPVDRIAGSLSDTSSAALFFGARILPAATDDFFVALKSNALSAAQMLGASGIDTFLGAGLMRSESETSSTSMTFAFGRVTDTVVSFRTFRPGETAARVPIGCSVSLAAGGGQMLWNPTIALTQSIAGSSGHFSDTFSQYRVFVTADSNLAVLLRDSSPAAPDSFHAQAIAFAVRRRSPLALADLAGPWQATMLLPESSAFTAIPGQFEFRFNGTGLFENGAPPPHHSSRTCTVVLSSDTLGGATRGDSFYLITFRPGRDSAEIQLRAYLSADSRFLTMGGYRSSDRAIGLGARRANSLRRRLAFDTTDTPISRGRLAIGLRVDSGASVGQPTFLISTLDTSSTRVRSFRDFRDTALRNLNVDTIHGAVTIVPDTTVSVDSVIVTIDIQGSADSTGGVNIVAMIFDEESGVWTRIPETRVTAQNIGIISFRPPHFSDFGAGEVATSISPDPNADISHACVLSAAASSIGIPRFLPRLRAARDFLLTAPLGIFGVRIYYSFSSCSLLLCLPFLLTVRARRA
ncbi:MAG: hypothetical protein AAB229_07870 [Candidatus Hydrogenedentota bacterium]